LCGKVNGLQCTGGVGQAGAGAGRRVLGAPASHVVEPLRGTSGQCVIPAKAGIQFRVRTRSGLP